MRLYQTYDLHWQLLFPWDYWGGILADNNHGKHLGFYPTPHNVVKFMNLMLFEGPESQTDHRLQTVCDPCLGTGRMLLYASNYSLRLYGMDINPTVIKSSLVNGYLYAPWMVKPFPFLDCSFSQLSHVTNGKTVASYLSDQMAEQAKAQPAAVSYLADTEHDSQEQWQFEPILKRRKKGEKPQIVAEQGLLF